ncbi:MAG: hypothetical protein AB7S41_15470 [Parvibaculaceae bacterium]
MAEAMKRLVVLSGLAAFALWASGPAHACPCNASTPAEGFDRAQYVFTGTVAEAGAHTWTIDVEQVWKGREKLRPQARLMDVYAKMDCEFFFEKGRRYIVFAIVAKSGGDVFYHPQVCNWTRPLRSTRVSAGKNQSLWLEDLIALEHGPGEPPLESAVGTQ